MARLDVPVKVQFVSDDCQRLRDAVKAILARHNNHCPMGSWASPGHDVVLREWAELRAAMGEETDA